MSLPHTYPFRWIEPPNPEDTAVLRALVSVAGHGTRQGTLPACLALEIIAQACALQAAQEAAPQSGAEASSPPTGEATPGLLAAIDGATFADVLQKAPLAAGDVLEVEVEETARFGRLRKVHGRLKRRGEVVVEAHLVLQGGS